MVAQSLAHEAGAEREKTLVADEEDDKDDEEEKKKKPHP